MTVATAVNSRPIIMSGESVPAIFDDRKGQTRRVVKPQPRDVPWRMCTKCRGEADACVCHFDSDDHAVRCTRYIPAGPPLLDTSPYGIPGDLLWVRETWAVGPEWDNTKPRDLPDTIAVFYAADDSWILYGGSDTPKNGLPGRTRVGRFLPRRLARLWLRVVKVRVQQLWTISPSDAKAEAPNPAKRDCSTGRTIHQRGFAKQWDSLNAKRGFSWDSNPWAWVIQFERAEKPA